MGDFRKRSRGSFEFARQRRAEGWSYERIAKSLGLAENTVRAWFNEAYREKRRLIAKATVHRKQIGATFTVESEQTKRDAERLLRQIPPDTRTPIQRLLGEPPPGRSALDQKRAEGQWTG